MNEKIISGLLADSIKINDNLKIYPISMLSFLLLDKIKSYILYADFKGDFVSNFCQSVYIMSHPASELVGLSEDDLLEKSLEFCNNIPLEDTQKITEAIKSQIENAFSLAPKLKKN